LKKIVEDSSIEYHRLYTEAIEKENNIIYLITEQKNIEKSVSESREKLEKYKQEFERDVNKRNASLEVRFKKLEQDVQNNVIESKRLEDYRHGLAVKEAQADKIIARENEIESRMVLVQEEETANIKRTEELNMISSQNRADRIRNSKRSEDLLEVERRLNERDNNLRILEAKG
jgi:hypothetical protein